MPIASQVGSRDSRSTALSQELSIEPRIILHHSETFADGSALQIAAKASRSKAAYSVGIRTRWRPELASCSVRPDFILNITASEMTRCRFGKATRNAARMS